MLDKIVVMFLVLLFASVQCFAMMVSQPQKVGKIIYANMGGFYFEQVAKNNGVLVSHQFMRGKKVYENGVAQFGNGDDALYLHYGKSSGKVKYGSTNINNTIDSYIMITEITKIKSDEGITFYLIKDSYDLAEEDRYLLLGRRKDGVWVKYFDSDEVARRYFGVTPGDTINMRPRNSLWFSNCVCSGNTFVLIYGRSQNVRYHTNKGEFRFTWDASAQWFGIKHIVY